MKDICLCIVKEHTKYKIHSIGIKNNEGKYYSQEAGGYLDLNRDTHIFEYKELSWEEFRLLVSNRLSFTLSSACDACGSKRTVILKKCSKCGNTIDTIKQSD